MTEIDDLPGADLVSRGLRDALAGTSSAEALLVEIAALRLRALGIAVPSSSGEGDAEIRLYQWLGRSGVADPYGQYNSLLRRLTSFVRALEQRRRLHG